MAITLTKTPFNNLTPAGEGNRCKYCNRYCCLLGVQITEYLLKFNKTFGADLVSVDLERGRDFGLPGYNKFRELCGLKKAKRFDDLIDQISQKVKSV